MRTCLSCGAPIIWAHTRNGARMPIDAESTPDGNVVVTMTGNGTTCEVFKDPQPGARLPHHATCPAGNAWRGQSRSHA